MDTNLIQNTNNTRFKLGFMEIKSAGNGTRTRTSSLTHASETCVSTNFTTPAFELQNYNLLLRNFPDQ